MVSDSYVFLVTIPVSTVDTSQKKTRAITGTIKKILIDIPLGWNYAAGIRFEFGERRKLPSSQGDVEKYFTGEDTDIPLEPNFKLKEDRIEIFGINNDVTNEHSCVVTVEVEK